LGIILRRGAGNRLDTARRVGWDDDVTADSVTARSATDVFEEHRPYLMGVAYRMLGRVADAEDVVQDAWLRWSAADRDDIRVPRAYLVRVTTRLALDCLARIKARDEAYVGPWLPEPYLTEFGDTVQDTAERAVLADSVSFALLVVLESLSPAERAVFVLREAFGYPYAEIAAVLDRTEPSVRQLAGRARRHVEERRPRYDVDPVRRRELTERFLAAVTDGDLAGLKALLAPDARLVGDGGGRVKAPLRVVRSADKVARFLVGAAGKGLADLSFRFVEVNGGPAVLALAGGKPDSVFQVEPADGRVHAVHIVRNPDKLRALSV
jgi:RNA polymerase sigma-70 factor, ECF subfamily